MKVHDVMSTRTRCVGLANTLVEAAGVMRLFNVGAVPVCDDDLVVGMLTERDIVLRGVADGGDLNVLTVQQAILGTTAPQTLFEDDELEQAALAMDESHVIRLPVLDHERHLVGMVSRADLAPSEER